MMARMVCLPYRLTAAATAALVLAAHLLCACATTRAAAPRDLPAQPGDPAHRCCQPKDPAERPAPAERHDAPHDGCPHCGGGGAVLTAPGGKAALAHASLELNPFDACLPVTVAGLPVTERPARRADAIPPPALSPATLLGLRCALNL